MTTLHFLESSFHIWFLYFAALHLIKNSIPIQKKSWKSLVEVDFLHDFVRGEGEIWYDFVQIIFFCYSEIITRSEILFVLKYYWIGILKIFWACIHRIWNDFVIKDVMASVIFLDQILLANFSLVDWLAEL